VNLLESLDQKVRNKNFYWRLENF